MYTRTSDTRSVLCCLADALSKIRIMAVPDRGHHRRFVHVHSLDRIVSLRCPDQIKIYKRKNISIDCDPTTIGSSGQGNYTSCYFCYLGKITIYGRVSYFQEYLKIMLQNSILSNQCEEVPIVEFVLFFSHLWRY